MGKKHSRGRIVKFKGKGTKYHRTFNDKRYSSTDSMTYHTKEEAKRRVKSLRGSAYYVRRVKIAHGRHRVFVRAKTYPKKRKRKR